VTTEKVTLQVEGKITLHGCGYKRWGIS